MGCPVILTQQSLDDLQVLVRFIAEDSPDRALASGNILVDLALSTAHFSRVGRITPEVRDPAVRELIHGPYRIIYEIRPDPETIFVLRFWHGARGRPEIPKIRS
jgi:toxin ParE1/3/4